MRCYYLSHMKISVSENAKREVQKKCHDGEGEILFREVFNQEAFESNLVHLHEGNEEIYYLTEGEGIMTVDGDERRVRPGDAIITHSGSKHGLVNNTDQDLKLLVFECIYKQ